MNSKSFLRRLDRIVNHSFTSIGLGFLLIITGILEFIESFFVIFESPFQIYQSVIAIGVVSSTRGIVEFIDGYDRIRIREGKKSADEKNEDE